jgi:NAD-reducing hydrogenase large subunit
MSETHLRKVTIEPVTRVEGHGKVTLLLDADGHVQQARLHIVEFRGFEQFIQGRPYWELPLVVQRLCGICPVSHHLAAAKAIDEIAGVTELRPAALLLRQVLHWGQVLQSHALHFFHLASPDLLLGIDSEPLKRNVVGIIERYQYLALQGVRIRQFGQEIIQAITGKKVHGIAAIPGGMNQPMSAADQEWLRSRIDPIVAWTQQAAELARTLFLHHPDHDDFATLDSHWLSLTGSQGQLELYDGPIRVTRRDGTLLHDRYDVHAYRDLIHEQVKSWSYMKFPYLVALGPESGWYRVGPLARINQCSLIDTPLAEQMRQDFSAHGGPGGVQATLAFHWARMIEALYCAESLQRALSDERLQSTDLHQSGARQLEGIGVIEAPRGTLFHHYQINEQDQVTMANLIVSTTSNNQAMNESIRRVADEYLSGQTLTEALLNQIEVAIRAYDPCLSCATHAFGQMPLQLELVNAEGQRLDVLSRAQRV